MIDLLSLRPRLAAVSAYRNLLRLPVTAKLVNALDCVGAGDGSAALSAYADAFYALHEAGFSCLSNYMIRHLYYDSAPYPELAAAGGTDPLLENAAAKELETFRALCSAEPSDWQSALSAVLPAEYTSALSFWMPGTPLPSFEELTAFYRTNGAGLFSRYRAFVWQGGTLIPVEHPDFIAPSEMVGYELQRKQVYANTASLVAGNRANNVLLFGDSGTGKSATVKSLLGVPEFENLRIIEMNKSELEGIPALVRMLGHRPQKFILYIDDLAFDRDDKTYSQLKTILEGGLEMKPANVAVYATSNRRHLVRETFTDRLGDEVDATETISEKTSLSERFGVRIAYMTLNQDRYLEMCYSLAERAGVTLDRDVLRAKALRWSVRHPGRTPRLANQFVQSVLAEL